MARGEEVKTPKQLFNFVLLVSIALAGLSCSKSENYTQLAHTDVTLVDGDDKDMNAAIGEAKKTAQQFILALQLRSPNQSDFCVKKPFRQGEEVEHIWLANVTFDGKEFHGKVENDPEEITGIKIGDEAEVGPDEISDWMYLENGKLVGGYTIRVLYSHSSAVEKSNFLNNIHFRMD
jgi:uncharacterized protein YegJ (DUF2314 family)